MGKKYKAFIVEEVEKSIFKCTITDRNIDELPEGDVLIRVHFSALNYKDALSSSGHKGITRRFPHQPGIDASGVVEEDKSRNFNVGDEVLVTGYDLGMNTAGGFGQYIRVSAGWVVKKPDNLSLREAMILGTAGFAAGLAIYALQTNAVMPHSGKVLVTGASGGVGSLACAILAKLGYEVEAATGKLEDTQFWEKLGINKTISRDEVNDKSGKPLLSGCWKGAIECVGGNTLSTVIRSTALHGTVCCLGNVQDDKFCSSVYPFLLRGINLIGIESAETVMTKRLLIWKKLANEWKPSQLDYLAKEIGLEQLSNEIATILKGGQKGKVLINLDK